jgi:hypothetical protein
MLAANHRYWPIPTWPSSARQLRWQRRRIAVDCRYSSSSKDELGSSIEFRNSLVPARNADPDRSALRANKVDKPR